jgi:hypothetical protein
MKGFRLKKGDFKWGEQGDKPAALTVPFTLMVGKNSSCE